MIEVPENLEARLETAALEQGVSKERIVEDAFLRQPVRQNAKGFRIPSCAGIAASGDPTTILNILN
jgi:hypothetical protein